MAAKEMTIPQKRSLNLNLRAQFNNPTVTKEVSAEISHNVIRGGDYPEKHQAALDRLQELFRQYPDAVKTKDYVSDGTVLHQIANFGTKEMAELAIRCGADVEATDKHMHTPLHRCAEKNGKTDVAIVLLEYNANINAETRHGITPLVETVLSNNAELCDLLVICGANPDQVTKYLGRSAIEHAQHDRPDFVKIMRDAQERLAGAHTLKSIAETPLQTAQPIEVFEKMKIIKKPPSTGAESNVRKP